MEVKEALKRSELFRDLDEDQLKLVEEMCEAKSVSAGTILCKQGEVERTIYVIEDGLVGIILEVGIGQRQVQAATNFETCGWSALIEPHIATATVKALEDTKVIAFDARELETMFQAHPEVAAKVFLAIARTVADRLRLAYTQLLGVTGKWAHS